MIRGFLILESPNFGASSPHPFVSIQRCFLEISLETHFTLEGLLQVVIRSFRRVDLGDVLGKCFHRFVIRSTRTTSRQADDVRGFSIRFMVRVSFIGIVPF